MSRPDRPPRRRKFEEPEFTWGPVPAGQPPVLWDHSAFPLWVQAIPEGAGVLLIEKEHLEFRDARTGAARWRREGAGPPDDLARDGAGVVLAVGRELRELDLEGGAPRWERKLPGPATALGLDGARVYVVARGTLFALDRLDGREVWHAPAGDAAELHLSAGSGLLLVSDPETESLLAYDGDTGARLWEHDAEGEPVVPGPETEGLLILSAHSRGAVAVEPRTGEVRWRVQGQGPFETGGVAVPEGVVLSDGTLYSLQPSTGAVRWRRSLADEEDRFYVVRAAGPMLLGETWRGRLLALDPADGALRWERSIGQVHGLALDERRLYLRLDRSASGAGWAVTALDVATGELHWELHARRFVPDITRMGECLVVEFRSQVLVLDLAEPGPPA